MLQIRTQLGPSARHGLGVFAVDSLPEGAEVWRFTPGFDLDFDPDLVLAQPRLLREPLLNYSYFDAVLQRFILCCDDARHINYGDTPNVGARGRGWFFQHRYGVIVALRDIAAGEEIVSARPCVAGITDRIRAAWLRIAKGPQPRLAVASSRGIDAFAAGQGPASSVAAAHATRHWRRGPERP